MRVRVRRSIRRAAPQVGSIRRTGGTIDAHAGHELEEEGVVGAEEGPPHPPGLRGEPPKYPPLLVPNDQKRGPFAGALAHEGAEGGAVRARVVQ
eukprot:224478-Prorocentrum_minimum.AAC.1